MKSQALSGIQVSKELLSQAVILSRSEDRFSSSAALVVLQDAVELIFLSSLIELGVDEISPLEGLSFDQMIGALGKQGVKVPKSGTLKAMNKQRVIVKHYGQIVDFQSLSTYLDASNLAIDTICHQVFGKSIDDIYRTEIIGDAPSASHLDAAIKSLEAGDIWETLVSVRKAIFEEIEEDYCIDEYLDSGAKNYFGLGMRGRKSPYYTRNKEWISNNVQNAFDFIQLDHENIRMDLMEWGASTDQFWNLWRLTPKVYRAKNSKYWIIERDARVVSLGITEENAKYCLDTAINLIAKRRRHLSASRSLEWGAKFLIEILSDTELRKKADIESDIIRTLRSGELFDADEIVYGIDLKTEYVHLAHLTPTKPPDFVFGYIPLTKCRFRTS